jgi:Cof subfamily protein (haloacid dehalogenase superfamily)
MPQNLLFFDLDGTLCLDHTLQVPAATQAVFPTLIANGNLPVVVTGRSLYEVQPLLKQLRIKNYILSNGSYIVADQQLVQQTQIARADMAQLRQVAQAQGDDLAYFNQQGFAVTGINARTQAHMNRLGIASAPIKPDFYVHQPVNFMNAYMDAQHEAPYLQRLGHHLRFIRYDPMAVNIVPQNVSKGQAIQTFLAKNNVQVGATYAFGDQDNDLGMFAHATYRIAMHAATSALQQQATFVATTDNGVLAGLQYYHLI